MQRMTMRWSASLTWTNTRFPYGYLVTTSLQLPKPCCLPGLCHGKSIDVQKGGSILRMLWGYMSSAGYSSARLPGPGSSGHSANVC